MGIFQQKKGGLSADFKNRKHAEHAIGRALQNGDTAVLARILHETRQADWRMKAP